MDLVLCQNSLKVKASVDLDFILFIFCLHLHLHYQMNLHVLLFSASGRKRYADCVLDVLSVVLLLSMVSCLLFSEVGFFADLFPSKLILTLSLPSSVSPF